MLAFKAYFWRRWWTLATRRTCSDRDVSRQPVFMAGTAPVRKHCTHCPPLACRRALADTGEHWRPLGEQSRLLLLGQGHCCASAAPVHYLTTCFREKQWSELKSRTSLPFSSNIGQARTLAFSRRLHKHKASALRRQSQQLRLHHTRHARIFYLKA
jgi:hypothetical protein